LTHPSSTSRSSADKPSFPSSLHFANQETFSTHLQKRSTDIKAIIATLFANATNNPPEVIELQARLTNLLSEEKSRIAELEQAHAEKEAMQERLESATFRYLSAEKKLDRIKSSTVAKIERQATGGLQRDSTSGAGDDAPSDSKDDGSMANGVAENDNTELREQNEQMIAASGKQKEQIEKLAAENEKLMEQITALNMKV
jgi:E3 ubiquitin-protein ligase BRE1